MSRANLKNMLRSMIVEYGFDQVADSLQEIKLSEPSLELKVSGEEIGLSTRSNVTQSRTRKPRPTATEYVANLELPLGKEPLLVDLARRFQEKSFLPTFNDISNFCHIYSIDEPKSKSRASAVPRIFKFIASMEENDIKKVLDEGMFSGPSRLGPIADAIRRSSTAKTAANPGGSLKDVAQSARI